MRAEDLPPHTIWDGKEEIYHTGEPQSPRHTGFS